MKTDQFEPKPVSNSRKNSLDTTTPPTIINNSNSNNTPLPTPLANKNNNSNPPVPIIPSTIVECFADGDDFGDVIDLKGIDSYHQLSKVMIDKFPQLSTSSNRLLYFVNKEDKKVKITPENFNQRLLLSGVVKEIRMKG